jgi:hypothetical protein
LEDADPELVFLETGIPESAIPGSVIPERRNCGGGAISSAPYSIL